MTNKEIAKTFQLLGNIMELHGENPYKIRSYQNAYINLRKLDRPLSEMSDEEIESLKGVGKAISGKIRELLDNGKMATLEKYREQTPEGVEEMLHIKGFGPKKIRVIWKELGAETIGELLYAVNENRLIELKGFGKKTQDQLKEQLEYYQRTKHQFHFAALEAAGRELITDLQAAFPDTRLETCGATRRHANVLDAINILIGTETDLTEGLKSAGLEAIRQDAGHYTATTAAGIPVRIFTCAPAAFGSKLFRYTASDDFLQAFVEAFPGLDFKGLAEETAVFERAGIPYIQPELREQGWALELAKTNELPVLVEEQDIKGVVHSHTKWSDGLHTLREMVEYARDQGYDYIAITDHSKAAFYANGLQPERVLAQMAEIDALNQEMAPFRIFKGIESDILNDGSLDYPEEILQQFDVIIASVHTNLRMDEDKATQRLLTAIENPYTSILGHPTGRLLLSRKGYPIDHKAVIDACAANGVAIELNANPYRLDLDWTWIPYALEKGVPISINPDAHSREGIHDIHYGVLSARKGGLTAAQCLNARSAEDFLAYCKK
ncbi:DNA polymerase/3'-5' exonuclease PolX [Flavilitoribacter nigricans]|uniref:DNA polymerase/3'-5' exonuclease PolX n=1 Tax=Flavilitoribacter nigricans (strain ATCC 23147 / DSM 23189 / NBRC 102662 / NCIMB 1420 / SS-2) TaxID=1122177 RepID=A0A2D0NDC6_FLAN2|nr:DNA polymerase/3'-5' exonuclease PolX [Flavilitoribacter nigricans]PHN06502.1 DNA polymerase/3'-5' exonuclease PolX [Flavilitoribacter nigricans DSM 23189 = NBRC 102662]